jgi:hypothetical protein
MTRSLDTTYVDTRNDKGKEKQHAKHNEAKVQVCYSCTPE